MADKVTFTIQIHIANDDKQIDEVPIGRLKRFMVEAVENLVHDSDALGGNLELYEPTTIIIE